MVILNYPMSKLVLFIVILLLIISFSYFIYSNARKNPSYTPGRWLEADVAINQAERIYKEARENRVDLSSGPCLSNALTPGWVADIVHNPRETIDDLAENQCPAYTNGTAKHFVELDLEGNLIRVK